MNDSGTNRLRIRNARKAFIVFCRSDNLKTVIDIKGLPHTAVENIVYGNPLSRMFMAIRYLLSITLYPLPFSGLKVFFYRLCGTHIGKNVYISPAVYIDMINPALVTIGNNVMIGMGAKIAVHERTMETLSLGRVTIGDNVTIGGLSIIRLATSIGENARIDMMCNITKNVPPNTVLIGGRNGAPLHGKDL
jgi:acetyltransferase-like isoleucine patch superfamily enzyme